MFLDSEGTPEDSERNLHFIRLSKLLTRHPRRRTTTTGQVVHVVGDRLGPSLLARNGAGCGLGFAVGADAKTASL